MHLTANYLARSNLNITSISEVPRKKFRHPLKSSIHLSRLVLRRYRIFVFQRQNGAN